MLLRANHPGRAPWVREHVAAILIGHTATVITAVEREAQQPNRTATKVAALQTTIGSYQRHLPFTHYDAYLARGWPIGTRVVEGACGHLVKDRMEQAGMRWTKAGAQAMRDLRAVRLANDWDAYWQFHRQKEHERLYGTAQPIPARVESQVLQWAA